MMSSYFFLILLIILPREGATTNRTTTTPLDLSLPPNNDTNSEDFLGIIGAVQGWAELAHDIFKLIDPYAENDYWNTIKDSKVQIEVPKLNQEGAINQPPTDGTPYLKVVCISDTHAQLAGVTVPNGDVLIHAGDLTNNGEEKEIIKFNDQMGRFSHKHKLVIAGNHELGFDALENKTQRERNNATEGTEEGWKLLTNVKYLLDEAVVIEGVKFYGSPYHALAGYPFYRNRATELKKCWSKIPNDTDVLITHTPAVGYLDQFNMERWGCRDLLKRIEDVKPKFHVFGHIHERYGCLSNGHTYFLNAAQCDKHNIIQDRPYVFYISKKSTAVQTPPKKSMFAKVKSAAHSIWKSFTSLF